MASSCTGMDATTLEAARIYYEELLSDAVKWYNSFHTFIYQLLCLSGVLANVCIVVVLLRPSMRKNPFNLFLIVIAICDMTLMASYFLFKSVELCHPWYFSHVWIVLTYCYAVLSVYFHSASLWVTVNMALLRYLVLKTSSSSRLPKMIGSAPNAARYQIRDRGMVLVPSTCRTNESRYAHLYTHADQQVHAYTLAQPEFWSCSWERFSFWTAGLLLKIIPCLLLTVFMTLLVRTLMEARDRRLRLRKRASAPVAAASSNAATSGFANNASASYYSQHETTTTGGGGGSLRGRGGLGGSIRGAYSTNKSQAERTTAMLTIIVAVFLITELPQGILVLAIGVKPQVRFAMHQLGNVIDLLSLLNSSVNFILYATMSNLFRHEFLHTFGGCFDKCWSYKQRLKHVGNNGSPPHINSSTSKERLTASARGNHHNATTALLLVSNDRGATLNASTSSIMIRNLEGSDLRLRPPSTPPSINRSITFSDQHHSSNDEDNKDKLESLQHQLSESPLLVNNHHHENALISLSDRC